MKLLLLALIITLATSSSAVARAARCLEEKEATTVPFDAENDLIVVGVMLDGKGPYRFILDTGASVHAITPEIARVLGLKVEGSGVINVGSKESIGAGLARVKKLEIGDISLSDQTLFVAPFPPQYPFQGFLGAELLKRFVARVDFEHKMLTLTAAKSFRYRGSGATVSLKLYKGGLPSVEGEVDGVRGWFKIDTGYNGSLALFGKFIDEHKLLKKYSPEASAQGGRTLAGEVGESPVVRVSLLKLGALETRDIVCALFLEKEVSNDAFAGAIGTGVFKQFNVVFNYPDKKIIFEKR